MPTTRESVMRAMGKLKCEPLLKGFRGAPPADLEAAADVILAVADIVEDDPTSIIELDINPLMLRTDADVVYLRIKLAFLKSGNPPSDNEPYSFLAGHRDQHQAVACVDLGSDI